MKNFIMEYPGLTVFCQKLALLLLTEIVFLRQCFFFLLFLLPPEVLVTLFTFPCVLI